MEIVDTIFEEFIFEDIKDKVCIFYEEAIKAIKKYFAH